MTDLVGRLPLVLVFVADHLWQSTLVAGVVSVAILGTRRASAQTRYTLWVLALAKFAVPSALLVAAIGQLAPELFATSARAVAGTRAIAVTTTIAEPVASTVSGAVSSELASIVAAMLFAVWLVGAIALLARWAVRQRRFASLVATGHRLTAGRETDAVERARRRLGLARSTDVVSSAEVAEPGVWGVVRPVLVLPDALAARLSDEALDMLACHELVHVARRDNLAGNLLHMLCCLVWFHPIVWLLERRLCAERECRCDELVLANDVDAGAYASTLAVVARFGVESDGLVGRHAMAGSNLRRRIERIMSGDAQRRRTLPERLACTVVLGLTFVSAIAIGGLGMRSALGKDRSENGDHLSAMAAAADLLPIAKAAAAKNAGSSQPGGWMSVSAASKRYDSSTGLFAFTLIASDPTVLERFSEKSFEIVPAVVTGGASVRPLEHATTVGVAKGSGMNDVSMAIKLPAEANAVVVQFKFGPDGRAGGFNLVIDAGAEGQAATVSMGVERNPER